MWKDLLDIRLLFETYDRTKEEILDLDDAQVKWFMDELDPTAHRRLLEKARKLVAGANLAKEVAHWEMDKYKDRFVNRTSSQAMEIEAWDDQVDSLAQRYEKAFEKLVNMLAVRFAFLSAS